MINRTTIPNAPAASNLQPPAPHLTHHENSSVRNPPSHRQPPSAPFTYEQRSPKHKNRRLRQERSPPPVPSPQPPHARERARTTGTLTSVPDEDLGRDHHLQ